MNRKTLLVLLLTLGVGLGTTTSCRDREAETIIVESSRLGLPPNVYQQIMQQYPNARDFRRVDLGNGVFQVTFNDGTTDRTVTYSI